MTVLSTGYGLFRGFPLESAILILTAFNLTNGASRLVSGYYSDKIGRNRIMSLAFLAAGLAYFVSSLGERADILRAPGGGGGILFRDTIFRLGSTGG